MNPSEFERTKPSPDMMKVPCEFQKKIQVNCKKKQGIVANCRRQKNRTNEQNKGTCVI